VSVESLPLAQAKAAQRLLLQYLVTCPACGKVSAVHADRDAEGSWVLVRFVCPGSCAVGVAQVLSLLPSDEVPLTA
jgi:hypothetical protein